MVSGIRRNWSRGAVQLVVALASFAVASVCFAGQQQLTGRLLVVAQDGVPNSASAYRHYLVMPDGRRVELSLDAKQAAVLRTGTTLRVNGELRGKRFQLLPGTAGYAITAPAQPLVATSSRRVAAIIVDIVDGQGVRHANSEFCDGNAVNFLYGPQESSLDQFLIASSYGALGIAGIDYPGTALDRRRVTVAESALDAAGVCKEEAWAAAADAQATAAGLNLAAYQHRFYILPPDVGCAWKTQAYQACAAGSVCRAWIRSPSGCNNPDSLAHMMGHNIGMTHALSDTNNDGTTDGIDVSDPMQPGDLSGYREFNAPHREQMGWASGRQASVAGSGNYKLAAIERQVASDPQVLKLAVGNGSPYYLSFRINSEGYDTSMPGEEIFIDRTALHRYATGGESRFIASVGDGEAFVDPANGLRITQLSHDAVSAVVKVEKGVVLNCVRNSPTLAMTPSSVTVTSKPLYASFEVTLTNKDNADCGSSNFQMLGSLPTGWTLNLYELPSPVVLPPGGNAKFQVTVLPQDGAANGTYPVQILTQADAMHASKAVSAAVTLNLNVPPPPCTRNKPIVSMTPATQTVSSVPVSRDYTLTITNTDSQFCPATTFNLTAQVPAKWSSTLTPSTAALSPGASSSAVVRVNAPATAVNGTYTVTAGSTADASHLQSRTSSKMVVALSSGGSCTRSAPLVSISPASQTLTSLPGSASYSVSVTNQDTSVCASSSFALAATVPAGWGKTLTPPSLSLAPGANASATLVATAPTGTVNASYAISVGTTADANHAATQTAATTIINASTGGADATPPTVPTNLKATVTLNKARLAWNASSDGGSGLAGYRVFRNGALIATVSSPAYIDIPGKGLWTYNVVAFDNAGNTSAPSAAATADVNR